MFAKLGHRNLSMWFTTLSGIVLLAAAAEAQAQEVKAGTTAWPANASALMVTINPPMGSTSYSVAVTPVDDFAGHSPTTQCTYFGIIKKTPSSFVVQHKRCSGGSPVAVPASFKLDWIAVKHTQ